MVYRGQASQDGSADYLSFMKGHNLLPPMGRTGTVMIMRFLKAILIRLKNN